MCSKQHRDPDNQAAWSSGSGAPMPETDAPAQADHSTDTHVRPATDPHGRPETDERGTDQESIAPGRSKPASEPAEDAPPDIVTGVPHEEQDAATPPGPGRREEGR